MAYYHFRLDPLDQFFFGDERSFGAASNTNYYVQSRQWPQQTTVLGMLRFELLRRYGHVTQIGQSSKLTPGSEGIAIPDLIGEESFKPQLAKQDFGQIKSLSPVWLEYEGQPYVVAPLSQQISRQEVAESANYLSLKTKEPIALGSQFLDPKGKPWLDKVGTYHALVPLGNEAGKAFDLDDIFLRREQVGIIKKDGQDRDSGGFYRQVRYRLAEGWSFAFEAEIEEPGSEPHHFSKQSASHVTLGGEKQPFLLTAKGIAAMRDFSPAQATTDLIEVHLLSDAFVADVPGLLAGCQYAFTEDPIDFRNVRTQVATTEQYHNLTGRDKASKAHRAAFSDLLQLIPRGSVFAVNKAQYGALREALTTQANWQQIGYQAFQILTPSSTQS